MSSFSRAAAQAKAWLAGQQEFAPPQTALQQIASQLQQQVVTGSYPVSTAGTGPAPQTGIVRATYVIVSGTNGGVFVYTGTPAAGNPPIVSIASVFATDDSYQNPIIGGGVASYLYPLSGTPVALVQVDNSLIWYYWTGSAWDTTASMSVDDSGLSSEVLIFSVIGTDATPPFSLGITPAGAIAGNGVNAGDAEVWHYVGTAGNPSFGTDWGNYGHGGADLAFRIQADAGMVEFEGIITPSSNAASTTLLTVPAAYIPASVGWLSWYNITAGEAGYALVNNSSGAVTLGGIGITSGNEYSISGRYSLSI